MKKFAVRWQETRRISCYAEVEAESADKAIERAQSPDVNEVEENELYTIEVHRAGAIELEE